MDEMLTIRLANTDDAEALSEIYGYYVRNTAVTFEVEPPSADEIARRLADYARKYPYLVIEDEDEIVGFAFAHAFRERPAYDYAAETSIYIRHDKRRADCGRAVYTALEQELRRMGVLRLYACIAVCDREDRYLSADSPRFHESLGYKRCGVFSGCGRKFDRWYDMIWMEKSLGELCDHPAPLIPYPDAILPDCPVVREPLSVYDEKSVRLVTKYGDLFYGEASYFPAEYGMHEFGTEEEGLQIGTYLCYRDEIKSIELQ